LVFRIAAWRDYEPAVAHLPGVFQGVLTLPDGDRARIDTLYGGGTRMIQLRDEIGLAEGPERFVAALRLIGDATAIGLRVRWRLSLAGITEDLTWRDLVHLHPPSDIAPDPGASIRQAWASEHAFNACTSRRGPGFVQIHDRRRSGLHRFTITKPLLLEVIETAQRAVPVKSLPVDCVESLTRAGLFANVDGIGWWMPYQMRRRPRGTTS
jgi:hypothetical protein